MDVALHKKLQTATLLHLLSDTLISHKFLCKLEPLFLSLCYIDPKVYMFSKHGNDVSILCLKRARDGRTNQNVIKGSYILNKIYKLKLLHLSHNVIMKLISKSYFNSHLDFRVSITK